jgi:aspartate kinase
VEFLPSQQGWKGKDLKIAKKIKIGGIIQTEGMVQIELLGLPEAKGVAGRVFRILGEKGINLQFIVQTADSSRREKIVFCLAEGDLEDTTKILEQVRGPIGLEEILVLSPVEIISIFGPHFRERPAVAGTLFAAFNNAQIEVLAISTSISTISCVIRKEMRSKVIDAIENAFDLP